MAQSSKVRLWLVNGIAFLAILASIIALREIVVPGYDWIAGNVLGSSQTESIVPQVIVTQPFEAPKHNLSGIQILFRKQERSYPENASLTWAVVSTSQPGQILSEGKIPVSQIRDRVLFTVQFDPIPFSAFQSYLLLIKTDDLTEGLSIGTSDQSQSARLTYSINGMIQPGTLIFNMGFTKSAFSLKLFIAEFITAIAFWLLFVYRNRWWNALKRKPLYCSVPTALAIAGLCFLIVEPPLQMYDEPGHFRRVWEVSTGTFVPGLHDGVVISRLPEYIQNTFDRISRITGTSQNPIQLKDMLLEAPGDPAQLSPVSAQSTSYNFLAYLLSALFVRIGVLLGSSALGLIYLARLANLIQYVGLVYWALRNAKIGKYSIAVVAMLGLMVTQGTAINVDSLLLGGSFLFTSSVINLAFTDNENSRFSRSAIWGAFVGAFCILAAKYVYFPLLGLALIIPAEKFGSAKKRFFVLTWSLLAAGLFCLALASIMPLGGDTRIDYSNINFQRQLAYLLNSPFNWPSVFLNTLNSNAVDYFAQYVELNQTDVSLGLFAILQVLIVLSFAWAESDAFRGKLTLENKLIAAGVLILGLTGITLPLYLTWTPVGAATIAGLQGRYFAPLILLALLFFKPRFGRRQTIDSALLVISMSALLLNQLWATLLWFY